MIVGSVRLSNSCFHIYVVWYKILEATDKQQIRSSFGLTSAEATLNSSLHYTEDQKKGMLPLYRPLKEIFLFFSIINKNTKNCNRLNQWQLQHQKKKQQQNEQSKNE